MILNIFGGIVLVALIFASVYAFNRTSSDLSPDVMKIKFSYLMQFDSKRTIGDVFDNFFTDPEWDSYKTGSTTYVEFKGGCIYGGERTRARVTFALDGDMFNVDTIKINGSTLNAFQVYTFINDVYGIESSSNNDSFSNNEPSFWDWYNDLVEGMW